MRIRRELTRSRLFFISLPFFPLLFSPAVRSGAHVRRLRFAPLPAFGRSINKELVKIELLE